MPSINELQVQPCMNCTQEVQKIGYTMSRSAHAFNLYVITHTTFDRDKVQVRRISWINCLVFSLQFMPDRNSPTKKQLPSTLTVQFSMHFNIL
jgi:hypothetical protein